MSEQIEILTVETQRLTDLFHFLHCSRNCPEFRRVGLIAVIGAELIVVVVLDAGSRQKTVERLEVFVGHSRSAVQQQHLDPRIISDALRPDVEGAARRRNRNHFHTAAQYVVAARVVEISARCG